VAKGRSIEGNGENMWKLGTQVASLMATVVTGGGAASWSAGKWIWTAGSAALTLDDLAKIEGEDKHSYMESVAFAFAGEKGVEGLNVTKFVIGTIDLANGLSSMKIHFEGGLVYEGTYDALNNLLSGISLVQSQSDNFKDVDWGDMYWND
jgi:hypothetical protein